MWDEASKRIVKVKVSSITCIYISLFFYSGGFIYEMGAKNEGNRFDICVIMQIVCLKLKS